MTANVLYYRYNDGATLYYNNSELIDLVLKPFTKMGLSYRSFTEVARYLSSIKTDGVMIYDHDDGPYLVLTQLNTLMYKLWIDDTAGCRGDMYPSY